MIIRFFLSAVLLMQLAAFAAASDDPLYLRAASEGDISYIAARIGQLESEITEIEEENTALAGIRSEALSFVSTETERAKAVEDLIVRTQRHRALMAEQLLPEKNPARDGIPKEALVLEEKSRELEAMLRRQAELSSSAISSARERIGELDLIIEENIAAAARYRKVSDELKGELERRTAEAGLIESYSAMLESLMQEAEGLLSR